MRIIVKDISACSIVGENSFNVLILMDNRECRFMLKVEIDKIGDRELQRVTADRVFDNLFRYDLGMYSHICKLVSAVYNHRSIDLPCDVGELEIERNHFPPNPTVSEVMDDLRPNSAMRWMVEEEKSRQS